MPIYDGEFSWEGFGGVYRLGAGRCRLRIFDLRKGPQSNVALLKPFLVVVSDLPGEGPEHGKMSARSCAGHIATRITERFRIDHQRMVYVEYTPRSEYGEQNQLCIPAKYEAVDFVWRQGKALHPKWRPLETALQDTVIDLLSRSKAD